jgi:hypothetical protein
MYLQSILSLFLIICTRHVNRSLTLSEPRKLKWHYSPLAKHAAMKQLVFQTDHNNRQ